MCTKNLTKSIGHGLTAVKIIILTINPTMKDLTTQDTTTRVKDTDAHAHERGALTVIIGLIGAIISQAHTVLIV